MGYFKRTDPQAYDKELYDRVFKRYAKLYPEAKDPDFEPNFSGHDYDWDEIWEEEYERLQKEYAETAYGPAPPPPKPKKEPKKKKKKKKKKDEDDDIVLLDDDVDPIGNCSRPPEDPATKQCHFDGLFIELSGDDIIRLDLRKENTRVYEVICGNEKKAKTLAIQLMENVTGPCDTHKNRIFYCYGGLENYKEVAGNDNSVEVKYFSSHPNIWAKLAPLILPNREDVMLEHKPEKIKLLISKCGRSAEVEVHIYPDFETSVELAVGAEKKNVRKRSEDFFKFVDGAVGTKVTKSLSLKHSYNGDSVEFGAAIARDYKNHLRIFSVVTRMGEFFGESTGGIFEVNLIMPTITLGGSWKYQQSKEYRVKRVGSIKFAAAPLIGIDFTVSLLKAGMLMFGVPPKALDILEKIDEWSGGRAKIEIDFILYAKGEIAFTISKEFTKGGALLVESKVSLIVGAKVFAKGEVNLIIKASAEASAEASASFSLSVNMEQVFMPKGTFGLMFDGLKLSLLAKYEVGVGWFSSKGEVQGEWLYWEKTPIKAMEFNYND